jgi:hypothetical protein
MSDGTNGIEIRHALEVAVRAVRAGGAAATWLMYSKNAAVDARGFERGDFLRASARSSAAFWASANESEAIVLRALSPAIDAFLA